MKMPQLTSTALAFALSAACCLAQDPTPAPSTTPSAAAPAEPARPQADRMEQFRQRMNEFLKTSLKVSDDEWSIIQPLLEKVQSKQREALTGRFGMMGGGRRGGDRGGQPASNRPERPANPESDALKSTLESESASPAEIKAKLEALRAAHKKAAAELDQAREELRKVLTQRQEATLVMVGILE
ncbi:MAG: hypothetical protein WCI40_02590 [Verrucomicrobiota bacterium]